SIGVVAPHSHHAVQVTLGLSGQIRFQGPEGPWHDYEGAVIRPNVTHSFDGRMQMITMLFVDPECHEGRWLTHSLKEAVTAVPRERFAPHLQPLLDFYARPPSAAEAARLITAVVHSLCEGPPPPRTMDERIGRALAWVRARDPRGISQEEVAREVFLSASRFAHLFTDEVGLPFRRYLLWRKLNLALSAFGRGLNLSEAAHAAGFSDSAHLTRTFHQMFGLSPSVMVGTAEFREIPAPFEVALPAAS
ncbi:MAG TPA: AraC family transcriptional regulator, partial [Gemmatimonadales bacterium]|nr:AraC family transcriptional regulator [Gemmatimonadales bacterium]